jgi:hypothetical protein
MSTKLETSGNYSMFIKNAEQRPIHESHVKRIMESMTSFGYLQSKPILCYRKGKQLVIVDGHHRFEAASRLQIPVAYIVEDAESQKSMLATGLAKPWSQEDCVRLYALRGNQSYIELQKYAEVMPIGMAASILCGEGANSNNQRDAIRDGRFKIKTREMMAKITSVVVELVDKNSAVKSRSFISCLSKCILFEEFDFPKFKSRLFENIAMLDKTANEEQMLKMFETIYNYRSKDKVPLAFLVSDASRKRGQNFGK